jgi:hypothetical protein
LARSGLRTPWQRDSGGDFGNATWLGWHEGIRAATAWIPERSATEPMQFGLRVSCLVVNDLLEKINPPGMTH